MLYASAVQAALATLNERLASESVQVTVLQPLNSHKQTVLDRAFQVSSLKDYLSVFLVICICSFFL